MIHEVDSIAIDYGFYKDIYHEFDSKPSVVMFVGVGFSEAQAFAISFSKGHYDILSYAHSNKVSSNQVDTILYEMLFDAYDDARDPDTDPDLRHNPAAAGKLLPVVLTIKQQFSISCLCIFPWLILSNGAV